MKTWWGKGRGTHLPVLREELTHIGQRGSSLRKEGELISMEKRRFYVFFPRACRLSERRRKEGEGSLEVSETVKFTSCQE